MPRSNSAVQTSFGEMRLLPDPVRLIFEAAPTPFVVLAPDSPRFTIIGVNQAFLDATMRRREDLIGMGGFEAFPDNPDDASESEAARLRASLERVLATRRSDQMTAHRHDIRRSDGRFEERWWDATNTPVLDEAGEIVAILEHVCDVTERVRMKARLREETERFKTALEAGAILGIWVWDIPANVLTVEERFSAAFGIEPERWRSTLSRREAMAPVHPDDVARLNQATQDVLERGGVLRCQYRVRRDGAYHWVEATGRLERGSDGAPLRLAGVLLDIDERRAIEAERDRALHLLQTVTDAVPGVVYAKDKEGRILVGSRGVSQAFGKEPAEYIGRTVADIIEDKSVAETISGSDRVVMESGAVAQSEDKVRLADGRSAYWLSTKAPLRDESGEIIGLVGSSVDITARKHAEEARDLLMREVDHRSRNALSVIQSVVRLTDATDTAAFRQAVIGRVDAMARAQSSLAKGNWRGALIGDVVADELADCGAPDQVAYDGPAIALAADQVQPFSMILHELATNATKYGALSTLDGKVRVHWAGAPDGGWRFEWIERGGPQVRPPGRKGFGSKMIERLAVQLRAAATFAWRPEGLSFELRRENG